MTLKQKWSSTSRATSSKNARSNYMNPTAASTRRKTAASRPSICKSTFDPPTSDSALKSRPDKFCYAPKGSIQYFDAADDDPPVVKATTELSEATTPLEGVLTTEPSERWDVSSTNEGNTSEEAGTWLHLLDQQEQFRYRSMRLRHLAQFSLPGNYCPSTAHEGPSRYLDENRIADEVRFWGVDLHEICPADQLEALCKHVGEAEIRKSLLSADLEMPLRKACRLSELDYVPGKPSNGEVERYLKAYRLDIDPDDDWRPDQMFERREPEELLPGMTMKIFNEALTDLPGSVNKIVISAKHLLCLVASLESLAESRREVNDDLRLKLDETRNQLIQTDAHIMTQIKTNSELKNDIARRQDDYKILDGKYDRLYTEKENLLQRLLTSKREQRDKEDRLLAVSKECAKKSNVIAELQTRNSMLELQIIGPGCDDLGLWGQGYHASGPDVRKWRSRGDGSCSTASF